MLKHKQTLEVCIQFPKIQQVKNNLKKLEKDFKAFQEEAKYVKQEFKFTFGDEAKFKAKINKAVLQFS